MKSRILVTLLVLMGCSDSTTTPNSSAESDRAEFLIPNTVVASSPDLVVWEERRELSWDDFAGAPDASSPYLAFSQVGSTDVIKNLPDGTFEILVAQTIFVPSLSWVVPEGKSDALLKHEQGHFDLEESLTRDFNAAVSKAASREEGDKLKATVTRLIEQYGGKRNRLQDKYDKETQHGNDAKKQAAWLDKIAELLGPLPEPCSVGAVRWSGNGHCYQAVLAPGLSWADAQAACAARGGHLATISSPEEDAFVQGLFAANAEFWFVDSFNNGLGPWIGGLQAPASAEPAGGWGWVTGETWGFTNWSSGEPNNCCGGQDKLRYFRPNNTGPVGWDDCETANPTSHRRGYIFESD